MTPEERLLRLENAFSTLAELAKTQRDRMDNPERRIELLIDLAGGQNVRIKECERLMEETRQTLKEVAEAQKQNGAHLTVLNSIVEELGRAQRRTEEKLAETDEALRTLAATVDRYIENKGG